MVKRVVAKTVRERSRMEAVEDAHTGQKKGEVVGKRLIALIQAKVRDAGLPERTPADIIGVTTIYWSSLCNGNRPITSLPKRKFQLIADFVGRPLVEVYHLADFFSVEDFSRPASMDEKLKMSIHKMRTDATWGALAPTDDEWASMPMRVKVALTVLYERQHGSDTIAAVKVENPDLIKKLERV